MRKHGWQLPYHPLQVVAIAVFLALGFAFYVFFVPFVGKKLFEYIVIGFYTPLVLSVFCLYIWCAAADPGDAGVFKSKKYLNSLHNMKRSSTKLSGHSRTQSPKKKPNVSSFDDKILENAVGSDIGGGESSVEPERKDVSCCILKFVLALFSWFPLFLLSIFSCSKEQSSEQQQSSEDGMFYCSLCEVEVYKYSKHCRVCDKCVDGFDHHCRWLNNCIGRKNYRRFFILMVSALLLLILQWSIGILVLVRCFIERKNFNGDIETKLGSSFSLVPFIVVVVTCSLLAMVATLPLAQLFFFHLLLMQKGISTYDYIIALREQEQHGIGGQQSPQMSPLSSLTGLSSASSFNTFHRAAWCTPPRLFVEDQFDVIPPEASSSKKIAEEQNKKKLAGTVKISPWTLARLNAEEVSKAAAQARKKSKVLQPAVRRENSLGREVPVNIGSKSGRMASRIDNRRRVNKRGRVPADLPLEPLAKISASATDSNGSDMALESSSLAPLQLEARTAFRTSRAMSSTGIFISSPDSSLESPDIHPVHVSSGTEETQQCTTLASADACSGSQKGSRLSRSTSDGYEASGGEDSDRVPSRIVHRSSNWSTLLFDSVNGSTPLDILRTSSSAGLDVNNARPF